MQQLHEILLAITGFVWGIPLIILLLGTGIFLTFFSKGIQFRGFFHGWALISGKYDDPKEKGETTHFQSLATALSATIGTGNIAGVATAIALGGPGAVFWMWVTALFGMSIKFHSSLLAQKYREVDENGVVSGGPAHYLKNGLNNKWLAFFYAVFTIMASFGIGNLVQANSLTDPLHEQFAVPRLAVGIVVAILVGAVIVGGVKRIAQVTSRVVPLMAVLYFLAALTVILLNTDKVIPAFQMIFTYAFNGSPKTVGGGFAGASVLMVMRFGIARGLFSNEAGLGSAAIAHAPAKTDEPVREGLVAMLGPFIDTIVICTMTALVIIISGLWDSGQTGAALSSHAFTQTLPYVGQYVVSVGLSLFAFTTLIGWSYYGDRNVEYLAGEKWVLPYRIFFIMLIPVGAVMKLEIVWNFSDIANALMAIPNLIGVVLLSGVVKKMTDKYFAGLKK
ncbi:sodium:alanine symporter family protein [bacterium]|nr:sodium:alanine symporter family protein [bacterium]